MSISPNLKQFILIETKEISYHGEKMTFNNYDELYYMLQKIIEYDVSEETISGLQERLPYALNKIVSEKLDRQDIITFFPIVWSKFEAYVKKIMFIIDSDGFSKYALDKKKTLPDYLERIGITYNVKGGQRTLFTQTIYDATQLRNTESHDCEYWSITKCYETLGKSLLAYLFVTDKCLDRIKAAIQTGNLHSSIPLFPGSRFSIKSLSFFDTWVYSTRFPGVDFDRIKLINDENGHYLFDENGSLLRNIHTDDAGNTYSYEYETTYLPTGIIRKVSCTIKSERHDQDAFHNKTEKHDEHVAKVNEEKEITSYISYHQDFKTEEQVPSVERAIEYLPDGSAILYHYRYSKERIHNDGKSMYSFERKLRRIYKYNHYGLLIAEDVPYNNTFITDVRYVYDNYMHIQRIEQHGMGYSRKGYYSYETVNDYVFVKWHDEVTGEETISTKLLFKDKKLIRVISYCTNKAGEMSEKSMSFEYYSI